MEVEDLTEEEIQRARSQHVRKANDLIQKCRYSLTVQEQKIVLFLISMIQPEDDDFKAYSIPIYDFCQVCGIHGGGRDYQEIKKTIASLYKKSIGWVTHTDGSEIFLTWLAYARILPGTQTVEIELNKWLKPYLLGLKANYTTYELEYPLHFNGKYSVRLYELVKSVQYNKNVDYQKQFTIDELRGMLDAGNYKRFCDFNSRVWKPAVDEVNALSDKTLTYVQTKNGRKVTGLLLTIHEKVGEELDAVRALIGAPKRRARKPPTAPKAPGREEESSQDALVSMQKLYASMGKRLPEAE